MARKMLKVVAGAAALLSLGAGVANAATTPAATSAWQSVGPSGVGGAVTAVTSVMYSNGKVGEFAFAFQGAKPSMYSRSGSGSWARDSISIAKTGERIVSAKAIGPNEVLVATNINGGHSRVLKRTGQKWTVLGTFGAEIGSASFLSASNVWVFGSAATGVGELGVWHYNGHAWTQVSKNFTRGAGVSGSVAWAASGTKIEHYSGSKWTATNIAGLLSSKTATVSTIFTGGAGSPYAIVTENEKDGHVGGPVVVLEYNGHAWVKVAAYAQGSAVPGVAAADGHSGLWFPVNEGPGEPSRLLHFGNAHHTLTVTALPGLTNDSAGSSISSIANVGFTKELAGGDVISPTGKLIAKIYYLS